MIYSGLDRTNCTFRQKWITLFIPTKCLKGQVGHLTLDLEQEQNNRGVVRILFYKKEEKRSLISNRSYKMPFLKSGLRIRNYHCGSGSDQYEN